MRGTSKGCAACLPEQQSRTRIDIDEHLFGGGTIRVCFGNDARKFSENGSQTFAQRTGWDVNASGCDKCQAAPVSVNHSEACAVEARVDAENAFLAHAVCCLDMMGKRLDFTRSRNCPNDDACKFYRCL